MNKKATCLLKSRSEKSIFRLIQIKRFFLLPLPVLLLLISLLGYSIPGKLKNLSLYKEHLPTELKIKRRLAKPSITAFT